MTFLLRLVLGAAASIFAKTLSAPFERIKLVEQCGRVEKTDEEELMETNEKAVGFTGTMMFIYREQGFWSFWNGNNANCL